MKSECVWVMSVVKLVENIRGFRSLRELLATPGNSWQLLATPGNSDSQLFIDLEY